MSCSCCVNAPLAPKLQKQLQLKLKEIQLIFPGTNSAYIIDGTGNIIAQIPTDSVKDTELAAVFKLKGAAIQFGNTLKDAEGPFILHIKGETYLFSSYDIGENLLVFYTEMTAKNLEQFEIEDEDDKVKQLCEQLQTMLHGYAQQS